MTEHVADPMAAALLTAGSGALGGAIGWLGKRLLGKAAIQEAVTDAFREVMDQMRQELRVAIRERDEARGESAELKAHIEELQRTISALEVRVAAAFMPRNLGDPTT